MIKCHYCEGDVTPPDKPYVSKQAAMEGTYHWRCFVAASKNRMPVGLGVINVPGLGGEDDDPSMRPVAASMEEK